MYKVVVNVNGDSTDDLAFALERVAAAIRGGMNIFPIRKGFLNGVDATFDITTGDDDDEDDDGSDF